jgi:hypothetical protein
MEWRVVPRDRGAPYDPCLSAGRQPDTQLRRRSLCDDVYVTHVLLSKSVTFLAVVIRGRAQVLEAYTQGYAKLADARSSTIASLTLSLQVALAKHRHGSVLFAV